MNTKEKEFAEKVLKHLCVGSQIDGIRFRLNSPLLYFMHYDGRDDADQLWLHCESRWTVYSKAPDTYPLSEKEIEIKTEEELLRAVIDIRREKVIDIQLGEVSPHLIITLESGKVLFVNGHHPDYECWQIGDEGDYCGKDWLIVAVPGDNIVVWAPDDFN
ncbi:hypothetical protein JDS81_27695 [Bacillus cereus group sp. N31]|uniref:hypothetical protein n=1 Tax=Bacillus cereus group sp. N31 TaxID=2794594 RepID=UPI0018F6765A|nr:hypothetical protein [Bacillus cereus group sp. N31]MBJ7933027.1 hypothetical protein [Bacillus cereus group sp. N31]